MWSHFPIIFNKLAWSLIKSSVAAHEPIRKGACGLKSWKIECPWSCRRIKVQSRHVKLAALFSDSRSPIQFSNYTRRANPDVLVFIHFKFQMQVTYPLVFCCLTFEVNKVDICVCLWENRNKKYNFSLILELVKVGGYTFPTHMMAPGTVTSFFFWAGVSRHWVRHAWLYWQTLAVTPMLHLCTVMRGDFVRCLVWILEIPNIKALIKCRGLTAQFDQWLTDEKR